MIYNHPKSPPEDPQVLCAAAAGATGAFAGNPGDLAMVRMQAPCLQKLDVAHRFVFIIYMALSIKVNVYRKFIEII